MLKYKIDFYLFVGYNPQYSITIQDNEVSIVRCIHVKLTSPM